MLLRNLIAMRTTELLAAATADGKRLGRPQRRTETAHAPDAGAWRVHYHGHQCCYFSGASGMVRTPWAWPPEAERGRALLPVYHVRRESEAQSRLAVTP